MKHTPETAVRLLTAVCLCVILVAGLWPFHSPRNGVQWLEHGNGLRLRVPATIISSGPMWTPGPGAEPPSCSLEVWLQPARSEVSSTILSLYAPATPRRFSLRQSLSDLALQWQEGRNGSDGLVRLYIDRLFANKRLVFVTVTSNARQTAVYLDGKLAKTRSGLPRVCRDAQPWLVAGTSPVAPDSWAGELRGLALYPAELSPEDVARHYTAWTTNGRPDLASPATQPAIYRFQEHAGPLIHSASGYGPNLRIPERFQIVDKLFLSWPRAWHWDDILLNWAGFLPLGACLYLLSRRAPMHALLVATLLGMTLSLAIETLQVYLPTRDSDLTDVITNTLGTACGALLCRAGAIRLLRPSPGWRKT